jgi:hypothetical protein
VDSPKDSNPGGFVLLGYAVKEGRENRHRSSIIEPPATEER